MNTDIRLAVGFWQHPKTRKTIRRLGLEGIRSLQVLWTWAAQNRPNGSLFGMDWEDIELAADWQGEERGFFSTCLGMWLDETPEGYALHDWAEHNSWAAEAETRGGQARMAKLAQVNREAYRECLRRGIDTLTAEDYREWKDWRRKAANASPAGGPAGPERSPAQRTAPSPFPSPAPEAGECGGRQVCPADGGSAALSPDASPDAFPDVFPDAMPPAAGLPERSPGAFPGTLPGMLRGELPDRHAQACLAGDGEGSSGSREAEAIPGAGTVSGAGEPSGAGTSSGEGMASGEGTVSGAGNRSGEGKTEERGGAKGVCAKGARAKGARAKGVCAEECSLSESHESGPHRREAAGELSGDLSGDRAGKRRGSLSKQAAAGRTDSAMSEAKGLARTEARGVRIPAGMPSGTVVAVGKDDVASVAAGISAGKPAGISAEKPAGEGHEAGSSVQDAPGMKRARGRKVLSGMGAVDGVGSGVVPAGAAAVSGKAGAAASPFSAVAGEVADMDGPAAAGRTAAVVGAASASVAVGTEDAAAAGGAAIEAEIETAAGPVAGMGSGMAPVRVAGMVSGAVAGMGTSCGRGAGRQSEVSGWGRESAFGGVMVSVRQPSLAFDQFFEAFPEAHRGSRLEAEREWVMLEANRALPGLPRILDALLAWEDSGTWQQQGGRYIPSAANFLKREYWQRKPPEPLRSGGSGEGRFRPRACTVAQRQTQDYDDMAKMLLQARRSHAHDRYHSTPAGQSGSALPAGGEDAGAVADSGRRLG